MEYTFEMPYKIQVILTSMKAITEMFDGLDSGSKDHEVVASAFQQLKIKLMEEIEKLGSEP